MKKRLCILLVCLIGIGSLAFAGGDAEKTEWTKDDPLIIRLAHEDPPDDQWGQGAIHFKELVEKKSNGRIEIQIFDNGQLGHGIDNIEQLQSGSLEMTLGGSDIVIVDKYFELLDLPYLFRDRDHVDKVLMGSIGDKLAKRLEAHGLVCLSYLENGFRHATNSVRPIVKPSDFEGLKFRVPESNVRIATFKQYGASPIAMSFSELYSALEQGVVDGQENPYGTIHGDRMYEVQEYLSETGHVYGPITLLIAKEFHDSLPTEFQKILKEAGRETTPWQVAWIVERESQWVEKMKQEGIKWNKADTAAFVEASKPVWDLVLDGFGSEKGAAEKFLNQIVNTK